MEFLRVVVALLGTAFAAYEDALTSYINDRLMFTMSFAGLLFAFLSYDFDLIVFSAFGALVIFLIGYLLYKTGQLGGGDVFLFIGLHLLLPVVPLGFLGAFQDFMGLDYFSYAIGAVSIVGFPFVFSVFVASSVLAMVGTSLFYFWKLFSKGFSPKLDWVKGGAAMFFAFVVMWFLNTVFEFSLVQNAFFVVLFSSAAFLTFFKTQIEQEVLIKFVPIKDVEDEDILVLEKLDKKLVKEYGLEKVLTEGQVKLLKRIQKEKRINRFPVYKNLPRFGPYVLFGLIASLLFGDIFLALFLM